MDTCSRCRSHSGMPTLPGDGGVFPRVPSRIIRTRSFIARRFMQGRNVKCPEEPDYGLGVADRAVQRPFAGLRERHPVNLDDLRALRRRVARLKLSGDV